MAEVENRPKNVVRVSINKPKWVYCNVAKYLLHDNEPIVIIAGLGHAVSLVVDVAEMLKNQGLVEYTRIQTSRDIPEARRSGADQLMIHVKRAATFEKEFAKQEEEKMKRDAARKTQAKK